MTIPIIPGPFNFLQSGHESFLDAYYRAQQRNDMLAARQQMQDMQAVGLFTQLLPFMQPTAQPGVNIPSLPTPMGVNTPPVAIPGRETFDVPEGVGQSFARLGLRDVQLGKSPEMRVAESGARVAEKTEKAQVATAESQANLLGARAGLAEDELNFARSLNPDQMRQYRNVASPEVAKLLDQVQLEKAKSDIGEFEFQNAIRDSLTERVGKDPRFRNLAEHAAAGTLGYLIAGLQQSGESNRMVISQNKARLDLLDSVTKSAAVTSRQLWAQQDDDWRRGFDAIPNDLDLMGMSPQKKAARVEEMTADYIARNPRPDPKQVFDVTFKQMLDQVGMTEQEYQQQFRLLSNLAGAPQQPTAAAAPSAQPAAKRKITQDQADYLQSIGAWDASKYEITKP